MVGVEPLTLVLDNAKGLPDCLTGENKSIGMRVTAERFSRELCRRFRRPIVSTSANISGMSSAPFFAQISDEIKQKVDNINESINIIKKYIINYSNLIKLILTKIKINIIIILKLLKTFQKKERVQPLLFSCINLSYLVLL